MSVNVKVKNLANVKESIRREFERIRKDPALLNEIGEVVVADVIGNARAGRDAETKQKFPVLLSESWVKTRRYLSKYNSKGSYFLGEESRKGNVTFTGKFLESFKHLVKASLGEVVIFPEGDHPGYAKKNGRTEPVSNEKLVGYLERHGFIFLGISKQLRSRINVLTKRFIRNLIKTRRL